jgi:hypothetical protein
VADDVGWAVGEVPEDVAATETVGVAVVVAAVVVRSTCLRFGLMIMTPDVVEVGVGVVVITAGRFRLT